MCDKKSIDDLFYLFTVDTVYHINSIWTNFILDRKRTLSQKWRKIVTLFPALCFYKCIIWNVGFYLI